MERVKYAFWKRHRKPQSPLVWLHIGLPKCGSSSLQQYFAEADDANRSEGVCYPRAHRSADGYRSHLPLAKASRGDNLHSAIADIMAEAATSSAVVISCEELADALPGGGAERLVRGLNEAFGHGSVKIVCYFRNIFQFVESSYAQFLLGGLFYIDKAQFFSSGNTDIAGFMDAFERNKGFPIFSPAGFVDAIRAEFLENEVLFRSVESTDLGGHSLIEDFCRLIGAPYFPAAEQARNKRPPNRRIAAFHYAQCISKPQTAAHVARKMQGFRFAHHRSTAQPFRNAALSLDVGKAEQIRKALLTDRGRLESVFTTGIDGICEDRWQPLVDGAQLTMREKNEVCAFLNEPER